MIYLDHAATTPIRPQAAEAMEPFLRDRFGNTSGSHDISRRVKNALEEAREQAAGMLGASPSEVIFTGGGTEADNLALKGAALAGRGGVVTVATEHEAVLETGRFLERMGSKLDVLGVDRHGVVDLAELEAAVGRHTAVVSVMTINNETGTRQPIERIVEAVRRANPRTLVHTDAIQAFSSLDLSVDELGVDLLSLAAHKFGGPQGVGLLYARSGVNLEPLLHGGGQKYGRRSGTHNVAGVVGMTAAMSAAAADRDRFQREVGEARRAFEAKLSDRIERSVPEAMTAPQHSHVRLGVENETMLVRLDRLGVAASAGSACQSGAANVSHVLVAMGFSKEQARHSMRFTFGWNSTLAEAERAAELVIAALEGLS
ncbi:MAG TPA: cysteine desulfurase family protein [Acidimicrobiia bacterium]|nr:cysteine desulfurase family protein [Acidimicrobiia bacterium]